MGNDKIKSSRRKFLKSAATLAGATIGYTMLKSSQVLLFAAEPIDESLPWYGIVIDIEKCIGCGNCSKACKKENDVPVEPFFFRTWIEQYTVKNDGSVTIVSPNGD
jgi:tetrathionate reductase subunit B